LGVAMDGLITTRHLLSHSTVIVGEFGLRCYLRCLQRGDTLEEGDATARKERALPTASLAPSFAPVDDLPPAP
jgi:allophanate hydrolase subunit 2